jgi:Ca2+-binding RTX toxin-like protein
VIRGGAGADSLSGGDGVDWLQYTGSDAGVTVDLNVDPNSGQQTASGGDAAGDQIEGFEYVHGSDFGDVLNGNDDRNYLIGNDGADTLTGYGGNDVIRGGAGADSLSGGDGVDWLQYTGSDAGVTVDLNVDPNSGLQTASGGDAEGDQIQGFEYVSGSDFGDVLIGNDDRNYLIGNDGADTIDGGIGNDLIRGGAGADSLSGGDGVDWLHYTGSDSGVTVDLNVDPTSGLQTASDGDAAGDQIEGFEYVRGSDFGDVLIGNDDRNYLIGNDGADTLTGNGGNDVIRGGAGGDVLSGGAGADRFVFDGGFGGDKITDFDTSQTGEKIVLVGVSSITDFADLTNNHLSQPGSDAIITDALGNSITLLGVDMNTLTADDFIF